MSYYSFITVIILFALVVLCILVRENARLSGDDKRRFYMTYALIAAAAVSEWSGIWMNGRENIPVWCIRIAKCCDYIFTPLAEALFVEQMKIRNIWRKIIIALLAFNTVFQIISLFTDWMIVIDEQHTYHHGILHDGYVALCLIVLLFLLVEFIIYGKSFSRQNRRSLYTILLLVFTGMMGQEFLGGLNRTGYLAFTLGAALMYIHYTEFAQLEADELLMEQQIKLRETDALREAKQAAEDASRAKSSFLANMSHEIRTPINAVLGMNEMILRECKDPDILEYAEGIKTASGTLLGLINDILDFSKIEAGKIEILPVDYEVSSLISDLINMISSRADEKGLVLTLDIDKQIPGMLNGDEVRIKQIITNILTNAVKYTEKGSVTFRVGYERIEDDPDSILLRVSVRDTGIGIKEKDMGKLFSQFERIEENRNRNIEGTGLGMSITMSLLKLMDSKLEVESTYGEGSVFFFTLKQKVVKWDAMGDYEASCHSHIGRSRKYRVKFIAPHARVLIVDDNPMNLMVIKSLIKKTLVQVDTADNGDECLALCADRKFDLIFLDQMMPGKDGTETLHELRGKDDACNLETPIICLTANAISGAREQYIAAGFDDYLAKPVDPEKLEEMMQVYLPKELLEKAPAETGGEREPAGEDLPVPEELLFLQEQGFFDLKAGMRYTGSPEDYLSLLRSFCDSINENAETLDRFLKAEEISDYTIRIHAIKSSLRTLGAAELSETAFQLEEAGKRSDLDTIRGLHDDFLQRFRQYHAPLAELFASLSPDADGLPEADAETMQQAYEELRTAAAGMDYDAAMKVFDGMTVYAIPASDKERWDHLREALECFDFGEIGKLLS